MGLVGDWGLFVREVHILIRIVLLSPLLLRGPAHGLMIPDSSVVPLSVAGVVLFSAGTS